MRRESKQLIVEFGPKDRWESAAVFAESADLRDWKAFAPALLRKIMATGFEIRLLPITLLNLRYSHTDPYGTVRVFLLVA